MIATLEPGPAPGPAKSIVQLCQTVSASRLNTWLACRLKFYFRYVAGITKPKTGALQVGSTVHAALRLANLARWRKQPLSLEALRQQFTLLWQDEQAKSAVPWEEGEEAVERVTAWNLVDFYLKESPIPPNELAEGVEVSLEADLSQHGLPRLIGILDLVRAGGRIVDYKTVAQTPSDEKAIHQNEVKLTAYAVLYRAATGKTESGRDLHQLVKTKTPKLVITQQGPMTEPQRTRLFRQMESYVAGVGRQDFVPSPGVACAMCSYLPDCRAWH